MCRTVGTVDRLLACLWCQKCHTFAVGVAPLMPSLVSQLLVIFLQLCVVWNADCVFSEGAIRNYQMGSSLGDCVDWDCIYLYCGGERLAHLKLSLFTFSTTFSVCGIKFYVHRIVFMWKWRSQLVGLLGYISTCQTYIFSVLPADCCITTVSQLFCLSQPSGFILPNHSVTYVFDTFMQ